MRGKVRPVIFNSAIPIQKTNLAHVIKTLSEVKVVGDTSQVFPYDHHFGTSTILTANV